MYTQKCVHGLSWYEERWLRASFPLFNPELCHIDRPPSFLVAAGGRAMTYQGYPVLASVSDGEERIIAALRAIWPNAPRQRCQEHFLGNLAEEVLENDTELRKQMRVDLGGLPKISDLPADSSFF